MRLCALFPDPLSMGPQKALETIGANLQKQYENWQPRVSVGCSGGLGTPCCRAEPLPPAGCFSGVFLRVFVSWSVDGRYLCTLKAREFPFVFFLVAR